jgi:hypothetical protein
MIIQLGGLKKCPRERPVVKMHTVSPTLKDLYQLMVFVLLELKE